LQKANKKSAKAIQSIRWERGRMHPVWAPS